MIQKQITSKWSCILILHRVSDLTNIKLFTSTFFADKLTDNPTLKIQIAPIGENPLEAANFDPTSNTISLYSVSHLTMKYPNLNEISNSFYFNSCFIC